MSEGQVLSHNQLDRCDKADDAAQPLYKVCQLWSIKTKVCTPKHLAVSNRRAVLSPSEQWTLFENVGIPKKAYIPKLQLDSAKRMKRIVGEQRRREYAEVDLAKYLKEKYDISSEDMSPPSTTFEQGARQHFLPLELFDDQLFESRTETEWLSLGEVDGVIHPVPAEAFLPQPRKSRTMVQRKQSARRRNTVSLRSLTSEHKITMSLFEYAWVDVAVVDYDDCSKTYSVTVLSGDSGELTVPRIYLRFKAENPHVFAERIRQAVQDRDDAENCVKYELYVDCMPTNEGPHIDERVLSKINHNIKLKKPKNDWLRLYLELLMQEVRLLYIRTFCDIAFRRVLLKNPNLFNFVRPPKKYEDKVKLKGPGKADYAEVLAHQKWATVYSIPNSVRAMSLVIASCLDIQKLSLYNTSYCKNVSLDEFERLQTLQTNNVIKTLQGPWLEEITHKIRMSFDNVGKGWFNINERNWQIYDISKLSRFMRLVKLRMQGSLRALVSSSTQAFVNLVESPCLCTLGTSPGFAWGQDLIETQFKPASTPIFILKLNVNNSGAYYSTEPEMFEKTLEKIFDTGIMLSHKVPQVDPMIMERLKYAENLFLSSLGLQEAEICALRER